MAPQKRVRKPRARPMKDGVEVPRRPPNSFMIFSTVHSDAPELEGGDRAKILGHYWDALPATERAVYDAWAAEALQKYKLENPGMKYHRGAVAELRRQEKEERERIKAGKAAEKAEREAEKEQGRRRTKRRRISANEPSAPADATPVPDDFQAALPPVAEDMQARQFGDPLYNDVGTASLHDDSLYPAMGDVIMPGPPGSDSNETRDDFIQSFVSDSVDIAMYPLPPAQQAVMHHSNVASHITVNVNINPALVVPSDHYNHSLYDPYAGVAHQTNQSLFPTTSVASHPDPSGSPQYTFGADAHPAEFKFNFGIDPSVLHSSGNWQDIEAHRIAEAHAPAASASTQIMDNPGYDNLMGDGDYEEAETSSLGNALYDPNTGTYLEHPQYQQMNHLVPKMFYAAQYRSRI